METSLITSTCTRVPIRLKYYKVIFLFLIHCTHFQYIIVYVCLRIPIATKIFVSRVLLISKFTIQSRNDNNRLFT